MLKLMVLLWLCSVLHSPFLNLLKISALPLDVKIRLHTRRSSSIINEHKGCHISGAHQLLAQSFDAVVNVSTDDLARSAERRHITVVVAVAVSILPNQVLTESSMPLLSRKGGPTVHTKQCSS